MGFEKCISGSDEGFMKAGKEKMFHKPPKIIYLIPDNEYGYVWCEDPAPGIGMDEKDAIKYVIHPGDYETICTSRILGDTKENT